MDVYIVTGKTEFIHIYKILRRNIWMMHADKSIRLHHGNYMNIVIVSRNLYDIPAGFISSYIVHTACLNGKCHSI